MTRRRGYALVVAAATSWGLWSLVLRPVERRGPVSAEAQALIVMAVIAIVLLPWAARDTARRGLSPRDLLVLFALGLSDAGNIRLFFRAMRATTLPVAVLSHCTAPMLVALAAPLVGERLRPRTLGLVAVALLGLALLLWPFGAGGSVTGALLGLASAVFYATNVWLQKRAAARLTAMQLMSLHALVSAAVLALFLPTGGLALDGGQWAMMLAGALSLGAAAGVAFVSALSAVPATHAATLALLEPLVAVVVGVTVWREPLGPYGALGAALMLAALVGTVRG
ncbi:MAG: DMT family transporter [Polyangiaceae bacterium]|nr:DMT family transporter [Polyangiaceae bacterium]